jgi:acetoin utilization deacetylase AcuC-like enzyme
MIRIFTDSRCLEHTVPPGFPECPERLEGILRRLREAGHFPVEEASRRSDEELLEAVRAVHDARYVERFRRAVERGDGLLDSADNPLSAGTWSASLGAVAAVLSAVDWILEEGAEEGGGRHAFVATRPPGHHAERATAMGYCYFNTIAVAAQELVGRGHSPVGIFDCDVHHGNGTQHLFEGRADILYASTHQWPFYPGTGAASERGKEAGEGATLNVPLAAGGSDAEFERAMEEHIFPFLRRQRPRLLLFSVGLDAWRGDPLGGMAVSEEGYRRWGAAFAALAAELCGGRSLSLLEGGYDLGHLPDLVTAYLEGLSQGV